MGIVMKSRVFVPLSVLTVGILVSGPSEWGFGQNAPTASSSELLRDSELVYQRSGGIAGMHENARLAARDSVIRVEYRPAQSTRDAPPESGQMLAEAYLSLWKKLEAAGLWTVQIAPPPTGADFIRNTLRAQVADKSRELVWVDAASSREAHELGDLVLEAARTAIKK